MDAIAKRIVLRVDRSDREHREDSAGLRRSLQSLEAQMGLLNQRFSENANSSCSSAVCEAVCDAVGTSVASAFASLRQQSVEALASVVCGATDDSLAALRLELASAAAGGREHSAPNACLGQAQDIGEASNLKAEEDLDVPEALDETTLQLNLSSGTQALLQLVEDHREGRHPTAATLAAVPEEAAANALAHVAANTSDTTPAGEAIDAVVPKQHVAASKQRSESAAFGAEPAGELGEEAAAEQGGTPRAAEGGLQPLPVDVEVAAEQLGSPRQDPL